MLSSYLVEVIILLIAAVVAVPFFQAIKLGAVPGLLISGIIIGPHGLGLLDNVSQIGHFAEIGVVFLLFVIGIELKPSRLWLMRRMVFGLGTLQVLATGLLLSGVIYGFSDISLRTSILVGPALALSSTAFVIQLLIESKLLHSQFGRVSFAILLLQDLAVVPLLALGALLASPELSIGEDIGFALVESVLILGIVVIVGRYFLHPILHRVALSGYPEVFTASAILLVLGSALVTEFIGLSMAMGAFLAGLLISDSSFKHQVLAEVQPFRGLLLGLFFISMGMSLNLSLLFDNPMYSIGLVCLLIGLKTAVLLPLTLLFGLKFKQSLAVALILAQSGEFALILFSIAYQSQILSEVIYQQLLLIIVLSMLATPILASYAQRLVRSFENQGKEYSEKNGETVNPVSVPLVIAGFGRVGHRIGEILTIANKPFIALDCDITIVESERKKGHPVFYGDVTKPGLLNSAGAGNAHTIIVTLNDPEATEKVVISLRKSLPNINIYVRGHSLNQCRILRKLGATVAVSENVQSSLELARMALVNLGVDEKNRAAIIRSFRRTYYAQINDLVD